MEAERASMRRAIKKLPLAVLILSCLFMATGAIGFAYHLRDFRAAAQPFPYELVLASLVRLTAIVCGAFLLLGKNWARWLALAWMAFHVVLSFFHSFGEVAVHAVLFLLIANFLFRSGARAFFRQQERAGV